MVMNRIPSEDGLNIVDKGRLVGKFQENEDLDAYLYSCKIVVETVS